MLEPRNGHINRDKSRVKISYTVRLYVKELNQFKRKVLVFLHWKHVHIPNVYKNAELCPFSDQ